MYQKEPRTKQCGYDGSVALPKEGSLTREAGRDLSGELVGLLLTFEQIDQHPDSCGRQSKADPLLLGIVFSHIRTALLKTHPCRHLNFIMRITHHSHDRCSTTHWGNTDTGLAKGKVAAPPGFEPEISASKADVLPLHYGASTEGSALQKKPHHLF